MKLEVEIDDTEFAELLADSVAEKILSTMWNRSMTDGVALLKRLVGENAFKNLPRMIHERIDEQITSAVKEYIATKAFEDELKHAIRSAIQEVVEERVEDALREYFSD